MQTLLAIAGGGALGAVSRYWLTQWVQGWLGHDFPYGTLTVNVLGCLLVGAVYGMLDRNSELGYGWHALLVVGFMGAFTTFSAFSLATLQLLERGALLAAVANVLLSVLMSLAACGLGLWAAERWT
jgi:fluoride exporter